MKKVRVKLDLENDTAEILSTTVIPNHTSSGHNCIPIDRSEVTPVENVCSAVDLEDMSSKERHKTLLKLHRQFAHPSQIKLVALLRDAGAWRNEYSKLMTEIYNQCQVCKVYKRTPPKPVVTLLMATKFNQIVTMYLKRWGDE